MGREISSLGPQLVSDSDWSVYMLECVDGTLYTGIARNLARRLRQHNGELAGGPKYTQGRRPVALRWSDVAVDRSAAQQREARLKKLSRQEKLNLIAQSSALIEAARQQL